MSAIPLIERKIKEVLIETINSGLGYSNVDKVAADIAKALIPEPKTRIERLKDQHNQLSDQHQSMRLYMGTDAFRELDKREKLLIDQQCRGMAVLLSALKMRLDFYGVYV